MPGLFSSSRPRRCTHGNIAQFDAAFHAATARLQPIIYFLNEQRVGKIDCNREGAPSRINGKRLNGCYWVFSEWQLSDEILQRGTLPTRQQLICGNQARRRNFQTMPEVYNFVARLRLLLARFEEITLGQFFARSV